MTSLLLIGSAWLLATLFALPVPLNTDLKIHELEPRIQRVLGYVVAQDTESTRVCRSPGYREYSGMLEPRIQRVLGYVGAKDT